MGPGEYAAISCGPAPPMHRPSSHTSPGRLVSIVGTFSSSQFAHTNAAPSRGGTVNGRGVAIMNSVSPPPPGGTSFRYASSVVDR